MRKETKDIKLSASVNEGTTHCDKCGHSITMLPTTKETICRYCGSKTQNKSVSRFRYMFFKERNKDVWGC